MWLEGCDHLVSSAGDPPGQQDVRPASRPLVGGDHPRRDGHQDPHVPGGLRDRRDLQDFPVSFFFSFLVFVVPFDVFLHLRRWFGFRVTFFDFFPLYYVQSA